MAGPGLPLISLHATIRQVFAPYCPSGPHGHHFWHKNSSFGIVKLLSKASIQKAQNKPSNQIIEVTSCVNRLDATIGAEDLSYFSSYQSLTVDKNWLWSTTTLAPPSHVHRLNKKYVHCPFPLWIPLLMLTSSSPSMLIVVC
jgi:hypothetical protein